jgi:hypothetical protein
MRPSHPPGEYQSLLREALIGYVGEMMRNSLRQSRAAAPGHSNNPPPGSRGSGWG